MAGILAATISSSDSYLLIAASAFSKNIFQGIFKKNATDKQVMIVSRITLMVLACIGILFALDEKSVIFDIVSFAWSGFGATFGPIMLFSLFWKRTNRSGAIAGMIVLLIRGAEMRVFGSVVFSIKEDIPFLYKAVENLKGVTTAFALVILGAEFEFSAIKGMFKEVVLGTVFRIVLAPALVIVVAYLLSTYTNLINFGVNEYASLIALFGSPAAVASVAMAEQMDGDVPLATQLVVWTSVFSILTIFLQVCILMSVGLI
jgi:Na+/proline symporter